MHIAILFSSKTGSTAAVAEAIREALKQEEITYFGGHSLKLPEAELYFVGSWTDKGDACEEIREAFQKIKGKKLAYFSTAGFGGDDAYFQKVFERVRQSGDPSNEILDAWFCQGKMPAQVRKRHQLLLSRDPQNDRLKKSLQNFDAALSHPDETDLQNAARWAQNVCRTARKNP